jgi:hypothetical protein
MEHVQGCHVYLSLLYNLTQQHKRRTHRGKKEATCTKTRKSIYGPWLLRADQQRSTDFTKSHWNAIR